MKRKIRKLKELAHDATALVDFLVQESVARGESMSYRMAIPYNRVVPHSPLDGDIVIDVTVHFDGVMEHEENGSNRIFKITGPDKGRH